MRTDAQLLSDAQWALNCNVNELKQAEVNRKHHQRLVEQFDNDIVRATEGIASCKARIKQLKEQMDS